MDPDKLARMLRATFLEEMQEHVAHINRELMSLEKNPTADERSEIFKVLFRSAHTLKGSSKAVNAEPIEAACHQFEEVLTAVRDGRCALTPELFSLLFDTADAIEETGMWLREEQDLSTAPLNELTPRLAQAATGKQDQPLPSAATAAAESQTDAQTDSNPKPATESVTATDKAGESPATSQAATASARPQPSAVAPTATSVEDRPSETSGQVATSETVRRPAAATTVRVAAEKLDSLLAKSGELLVARRRVSSRAAELIELRDLVANWKHEWNSIDDLLRAHSFFEPDVSDGGSSRLPRRAGAVLAANRQRLRQLEKRMDRLVSTIQADSRHLDMTCDSLDDEVHQVRMLPFAEACQGLERAARDVARKSGKKVEVIVDGNDVEIDRSVLEGLKDPLLHLVRNAVDHGLEATKQRLESGKPDTGVITISAALRGTEVEVIVADDGRGVDVQRIREKVREKGLPEPSDEAALVSMLFHPSFSTAPVVTDISGRGVGLDVVQNTVESLHGTVQISFAPGKGTQFIIRVPLTLTTIRTVLVDVAGQTYGIATSSVEQLVRFAQDQLGALGGHQVLLLKNEPLPLARLADTLGLSTTTAAKIDEPGAHGLAIVLNAGGRRVGVVVDEVLSEQEVVVKSLGSRIRRVRHVAGAALLPSGRVALVLNMANVIRTALETTIPAWTASHDSTVRRTEQRLLVVDDSLTTRTLMKSILQAAGYSVEIAVDGAEAWRRIQESKPDLVVSDVDMPRMNGFELTSTIRKSTHCSALPVILVTARQSDEDRTRGVQAGADAYILKSSFDQQELLENIAQLL